jgi:hypothetical protein
LRSQRLKTSRNFCILRNTEDQEDGAHNSRVEQQNELETPGLFVNPLYQDRMTTAPVGRFAPPFLGHQGELGFIHSFLQERTAQSTCCKAEYQNTLLQGG